MISRLRMENFRRHELTELIIDPSDQIIAVSGSNGSGKSTILEAIIYALFGQSRHGAKDLESLVRRGAELEGMSVELDFSIEDNVYTVSRRRDNKVSSAVLYVNGSALVEGVSAVNAAVTNLLGTDASGFKLAAVAQQKELDSLIKLGPTARGRAVNRLLRIDAITRAKEGVGKSYNDSRRALEVLPTPGERELLKQAVTEAEADLEMRALAEQSARTEIARLAGELAKQKGSEEAYLQARDDHSSAAAASRLADIALAKAEAALAMVVVPPKPSENNVDVDSAAEDAARTGRELAVAEAAAQSAEDIKTLEGEVARLEANRAELQAENSRSPQEIADASEAAEKAVKDLSKSLGEQRAIVSELRETAGEKRALVTSIEKQLAAVEELGSNCYTCGQDIEHDHMETIKGQLQEQISTGRQEVEKALEAVRIADENIASGENALKAAEGVAAACGQEEVAYFNRQAGLAELEQHLRVYRDRIARHSGGTVDVEALRVQDAAARDTLDNAKKQRDAALAYEEAQRQFSERELAVAETKLAQKTAADTLKEAAIAPAVVAAWETYQDNLEKHRQELEMLSALTQGTAEAKAELDATKKAFEQNEEAAARRSEWVMKGTVTSIAKEILTKLEQRVGASARPTIEAVASDLVESLSEGRFTSIKLTKDFTPSVFDDGAHRPLSDLSGGEADLVALAIRLALADVVGDQGTASIGFLILDEVLGSLDAGRRESTLTTLRTLRNRYGQVWTISHVGGVEDFADRIIEIEVDSDGIAGTI